MGFFVSKPMFDQETMDWLFGTYQWSLRLFDAKDLYRTTELILPNDKYFPDTSDGSEFAIERLFLRVRRYAGMEDWACKLVPQEVDANPIVSPTVVVAGVPSTDAGSFQIDNERSPVLNIVYNPALINRPEALVATMANGLAYYLIDTAGSLPPGGKDYIGHAADLVSVALGFGVFMSNSAFSFSQYSDNEAMGWQTQSQGFLSTAELSYCSAIFLQLKGIDLKPVAQYFDKNSKYYVKRSVKELKFLSGELEKLRSIG